MRYLYLSIVYCLLSIASPAQFTINQTANNVTCPGGNDGTASVFVFGGTLPYTYQWLPGGQITPTITALTAQNYSVIITDNTGNDSTIVVPVSEPPPILANDTMSSPFCVSNGYIVLSPSGGTSPYQFSWSTGQSAAGITQLGAGDYSVTVTDAKNCAVSFTYSLAQNPCFVSPESYFTPNGDGINDFWIIHDSQYFEDARVIVFDRWGTKVYEHKGTYELWDGKSYLGIPVPDAVYYYFFYQDKDDKQKDAKYGSLTIIR